MAFDFTGTLETSHTPAREATHLGFCEVMGKHRVLVLGDYAAKLSKNDPAHKTRTVFLYDDEGRCRGADGSGAEFDLIRVEARRAA